MLYRHGVLSNRYSVFDNCRIKTAFSDLFIHLVFKLIGVYCLAALGRDLELVIYPVKCVVLFNKGEFEIWDLGFH